MSEVKHLPAVELHTISWKLPQISRRGMVLFLTIGSVAFLGSLLSNLGSSLSLHRHYSGEVEEIDLEKFPISKIIYSENVTAKDLYQKYISLSSSSDTKSKVLWTPSTNTNKASTMIDHVATAKTTAAFPKVIRYLKGWDIIQEKLPPEITCGSNRVCKLEAVNNFDSGTADMVVFYGEKLIPQPPIKPKNQLWLLTSGESERHLSEKVNMQDWDGYFNYTFSYFRETNANMFKAYMYNITKLATLTNRNFANEKREKYTSAVFENSALWFVSNCDNVLSARLEYAIELSRQMSLSVYTRSQNCKRKISQNTNNVVRTGKEPSIGQYLFYLAFENTLCRDYITEKFWYTLGKNSLTIPIVLGGLSMEDYEIIAPENSYIHVKNFTSPVDLVKHLKFVSENDEAFNYYHQWRNKYSLTKPDVNILPKQKYDYFDPLYHCPICTLAHEQPHYAWNNISKVYNRDQCIDISRSESYTKYYNIAG